MGRISESTVLIHRNYSVADICVFALARFFIANYDSLEMNSICSLFM